MKIDSKIFKSLLKEKFAPTLRKYGFKGSGFIYRKITNDHYIYTLDIQANVYGGECCIEMGVHLDFIPAYTDEEVDINKFSSFNSDFRKRLSSNEEKDQWWEYGNSMEEAKNSIEDMISVFETYGITFFNQFTNFPQPLTKIKINDLEASESAKSKKQIPEVISNIGAFNIRLAMQLSRVYVFIGEKDKGREFAEWGLKHVGRGVGLIPILKSLSEGKFK